MTYLADDIKRKLDEIEASLQTEALNLTSVTRELDAELGRWNPGRWRGEVNVQREQLREIRERLEKTAPSIHYRVLAYKQ